MGQLMRLVLVAFYKSGRSGLSEHERRQKEDAGASSAWLNTVFPVHFSDADESVDGVAETDFSPSHAAVVVVAAPTGCLDSDCLTTCDICKFGAGEPEVAEDVKLLVAVLEDMEAVDALREKSKDSKNKKGPSFFHRGAHEAWYEQLALAPRGRGRRVQTELQISGRMGC